MTTPATPRDSIRTKVAALLTSIALSLLLAELMVRAYLYTQGHYRPIVGIPHPIYHHDLKPSFSNVQRFGGIKTQYATNNLGFRDRQQRVVARDTSSYRIVFIGDSFTEGVGIPYDKTFVGIIQNTFTGTDILNAAVSSYAPVLENLKIREKILPLKPDHIVMLIDPSDVQDSIVYHDWLQHKDIPQVKPKRSLAQRTLRRSALFSTIIDEIAPGYLSDWAPPTLSTPSPWSDYRGERPKWLYDRAIWKRWGRRGFSLLLADLQETIQLTAEHDIKLTLVIYPWPSHIINSQRVIDYNRRMRVLCDRYGTQLIDLFPDFDSTMLDTHFIKGDVHWTEVGHALVAMRLTNELTTTVRAATAHR